MQRVLTELGLLVRQARREGAAGVEILTEDWSGHRLDVERGRVMHHTPVSGQVTRIRVWIEGGKQGAAQAEGDCDREALMNQALQQAHNAEADEFSGPQGRLAGLLGGLGIDDRRFGQVEEADRAEVALTAERAARAVDRRLVPSRSWYEDRRRVRTFVNSRDVALSEADTTFRAGTTVTAAGELTGVSHEIESRSFSSIASLPIGTSVGQMAAAQLKRGETLDGEVKVLLWPHATAALFSALARGFTQGPDFFLRNSERDGLVASSRLHVVDDGTLVGGLRSASFDDRGVVPLPVVLLREGRLEGDLVTLRAGREGQVHPTGHETSDGLSCRNLSIRAGSRSVSAMLTHHEGWVLSVYQLPSLAGLDLSTGQIELPVSGSVMHGSKQVGAVRNGVLRGDLRQILHDVTEVMSNTDRVGHVDAPAILLGGFVLDG